MKIEEENLERKNTMSKYVNEQQSLLHIQTKWKNTLSLIGKSVSIEEEDTSRDILIPRLVKNEGKFVKWGTTVDKAHVPEIEKIALQQNFDMLKKMEEIKPIKYKHQNKWKSLVKRASVDEYCDMKEESTLPKVSDMFEPHYDFKVPLNLNQLVRLTSVEEYKSASSPESKTSSPNSPKYKYKGIWKNIVKTNTKNSAESLSDQPQTTDTKLKMKTKWERLIKQANCMEIMDSKDVKDSKCTSPQSSTQKKKNTQLLKNTKTTSIRRHSESYLSCSYSSFLRKFSNINIDYRGLTDRASSSKGSRNILHEISKAIDFTYKDGILKNKWRFIATKVAKDRSASFLSDIGSTFKSEVNIVKALTDKI